MATSKNVFMIASHDRARLSAAPSAAQYQSAPARLCLSDGAGKGIDLATNGAVAATKNRPGDGRFPAS
jgi:hypothetical protein